MARVLLDLNNPVFQEGWFALEREDALAVLSASRKLRPLDWDQLYRDSGLRWEAILSRSGPAGHRALAYREGDFLRFLTCRNQNVAVRSEFL
ncbi:MAG: hypothetical protein LAP39_05115 [Acidobacteriia bacterium]|nr:hypothetical protein [Terriglobia bacterium]